MSEINVSISYDTDGGILNISSNNSTGVEMVCEPYEIGAQLTEYMTDMVEQFVSDVKEEVEG